MKLVIKLFPEIIVKSRPVRQRMIGQLRKNLRAVLRDFYENVVVSGTWDRLEVETKGLSESQQQQVIDILQCTPGIHHFFNTQQFEFTSFENLIEICVQNYLPQIEGKTFCVRAKRAGRHSFNSHELEQQVGGALFTQSKNAKVDLHHPEITVLIEIRDKQLYAIANRYKGLGGFPLGTQDSCLSLISGGYDSTVASYLMLKRGIRTHFCFFNLGGIAHEVGVKQVSHFIWKKFGSSSRTRFFSVPFQPVVEELLTQVHHSMRGVILKRLMIRAAQILAKESSIPALVTGEAIAQVSSQTMTNLSVIDQISNMLVVRPLATTDKEDIIAMARQIGTEHFARTMPEYCGVISDRPTTAARMDKIEAEEARFNFDVLMDAIKKTEITTIDQVMDSVKSLDQIERVSTPSHTDVIIDIRHPEEEEKKPLFLTSNKIVKIPFFELNRKFPKLEQDQQYLLYCDHGVMSEMQAQELHEKGFPQVKVYRAPKQ
ncbi:MAG: tRNA 4-thiouridine(8) synthase ThiI [Gammaproteobacteria bacterium CG22_combo_CG10-13_8_21_14_all_40_8]|nr:MAG: tRNA 4-thiouridine(8) synthase ThiI [Gammaproteobacteria bacterium CG22_combo_CG10-13_8_21_14_all_40_8]